jgi:hypothetical protein
LILATLIAAGCAANRPLTVSQKPATQPAAEPKSTYQPALASALVFDSSVMPSFPLPGLDRGAREPSAFLGYDQTITESYFIFTDDDQNSCPFQDSYEREAIYAKVGTRTR